jgi:hypothetical protein
MMSKKSSLEDQFNELWLDLFKRPYKKDPELEFYALEKKFKELVTEVSRLELRISEVDNGE